MKNEEGVEGLWTVDLKKEGKFYKGEAKSQPGLKKADVRIIMADDVFVQFAEGKVIPPWIAALHVLVDTDMLLIARRTEGIHDRET